MAGGPLSHDSRSTPATVSDRYPGRARGTGGLLHRLPHPHPVARAAGHGDRGAVPQHERCHRGNRAGVPMSPFRGSPTGRRVVGFQTRTVSSELPVTAIGVPSGSTSAATEATGPVWRVRGSPTGMSRTRVRDSYATIPTLARSPSRVLPVQPSGCALPGRDPHHAIYDLPDPPRPGQPCVWLSDRDGGREARRSSPAIRSHPPRPSGYLGLISRQPDDLHFHPESSIAHFPSVPCVVQPSPAPTVPAPGRHRVDARIRRLLGSPCLASLQVQQKGFACQAFRT
jgi:hypothetical protein